MMKGFLFILFIVLVASCNQPKKEDKRLVKDSVVIDQWVPYDTTTKSVTMCKIDGRVYLYNTLADKSVFKEELLPDTIKTGVKLTYMNPGLSTMGEYYLIDKEGKLRYFGADGTEYSKEVPKF